MYPTNTPLRVFHVETTWKRYLNENILNSIFELLHASEIRQISVIQKLQINFKEQKYTFR